jgi:Uma2 family endonuclease
MSLIQTKSEVEYPESDGKPLGETDLHIDWILRLRSLLKYRYRDQRVYVASDLLLYYVEGDPKKFVVPDGFVVKDCDPGRRRTFKTWEEGKSPDVVFEITSLASKREDQVLKPKTYARLGVKEYFIFDPTSDYLEPPLQGFRMAGGRYEPIEPDETRSLRCEELQISLRLEDADLVMQDLNTGEVLLTDAEAAIAAREAAQAAREAEQAAREAEQAARQAEQALRESEQAARQAAEARAAELEAELRRLRAELDRRGGGGDS